ncbi:MAG: DUF98 domain-containing protein [Methanomicrobiales archaeon]|nr:DUF98 domain-containing protein [Methanomicrobiales archaeon]
MTMHPFYAKIRDLEASIGPFSPMQRVLLTTDGSVTALLEAASGHDVVIRTRSQEVTGADERRGDILGIPPGEAVNHRIVELKDAATGEVLLYAVSDTPLSRLQPEWREDLMRADIPIGKILKKHHIEGRRELDDVCLTPAGPPLAGIFGIAPGDPVICRKYRIIHHGAPLMHIEEMFPLSAFSGAGGVLVHAPSRLHVGLIDLHGGLARVDGGMGIALSEPATLLEARPSRDLTVRGEDPDACRRVEAAAQRMLERLGVKSGAAITIHHTPPPHVGLGSGTALALASARAVCELNGACVPVREMAAVVGRGGTSGIGTGAFDSGGFLVDGGHSFGKDCEKTAFLPSSYAPGVRPPPVTVRHPFPDDWHILLVTPHPDTRISGTHEKDVFTRHCPVAAEEVREVCRQLVMRILPGVVDHDLDLFGTGINSIQETGFKKVERSLQAPVIHRLLGGLCDAGAACSGLSSFGPTVYAITDSNPGGLEQAARDLLDGTDAAITTTHADNGGARVRAC